MSEKADDPAFATGSPEHGGYSGMCLRTYVATAAMRGYLSNADACDQWTERELAKAAVAQADSLIAELTKEPSHD